MEEVGRPQLQQDVAHELPLAHFGHDAKSLRDAAEPALFLEKSLGEGVVGEDESLAGGKVVFLLDPVKHFARGLLREGQEQNLFSRHAVLPQSAVALDQHPRLPGARTGHDQEWPTGVVHRCPLGLREGGGTRNHPEDCRKRISRTAGAPIRSLSRSISMVRSRCSWCASAGLLAVTSSVPPVSLSALVSRSRSSPTTCGHSHSACASRVRRVMPSAVSVLGSAAPMLRMNPTLLDPEDRGALQDALRQVVEVGRGDQGLGPWLECGQQALAARRVELGHHVIEEKYRLLAGHLGEIVQFRQLQAQHGAALLPLAGIEPGFMVVEPHLDIVALRSDSCLSTPDLLVARLTHGGLELFHDELQRRLADSGTRGPVAELEPLAIVAWLAVKGGCDGL